MYDKLKNYLKSDQFVVALRNSILSAGIIQYIYGFYPELNSEKGKLLLLKTSRQGISKLFKDIPLDWKYTWMPAIIFMLSFIVVFIFINMRYHSAKKDANFGPL